MTSLYFDKVIKVNRMGGDFFSLYLVVKFEKAFLKSMVVFFVPLVVGEMCVPFGTCCEGMVILF